MDNTTADPAPDSNQFIAEMMDDEVLADFLQNAAQALTEEGSKTYHVLMEAANRILNNRHDNINL